MKWGRAQFLLQLIIAGSSAFVMHSQVHSTWNAASYKKEVQLYINSYSYTYSYTLSQCKIVHLRAFSSCCRPMKSTESDHWWIYSATIE